MKLWRNYRNPNVIYLSMRTVLPAMFVFVCLFMFVHSAGAQEPVVSDNTDEYVFGPGDVLEVLVYQEPELSQTILVRIDGRISLPLVGEFLAYNKTPAALADAISKRLSEFVENTDVTVILRESNSKVYYVLGQIATPGEYNITQPVTVLQAIARAGGLLEWAKRSDIMIVSRPGLPEKITYFDYDRFLKGKGKDGNIVINPGDTIVIP